MIIPQAPDAVQFICKLSESPFDSYSLHRLPPQALKMAAGTGLGELG